MIDLSSTADMKHKPTLYQINRMLDEFIVGEQQARMAIFTNWILGLQNVNVTGQRAAGKTHTVGNVAKFLPERGGVYNLSSGSEKSAIYQEEEIKQHSHIMIPELNKVPKQALELLKDWGEGKSASYAVTVGEGRYRYVDKKLIPPKPFIFCLADEEELKMDEQLRSRLTVVRMDISEEQNLAVMEQKAELAMRPDNPNKVDKQEFKKMKMHIQTMPKMDVTKIQEQFKHPASVYFTRCIPKMYTDCRRDFPKYLANTYGITRFYWKERIQIDINGQKAWLVAPQDMYHNHTIYGDTLIESSMRCSNMERQLIAILEKNDRPMGQTELQIAVRKLGMNISAHMLTRYMKSLSEQGYVNVAEVSRNNKTYEKGTLFKDFKFEVEWSEVLKQSMESVKKYYPEVADEYYEKHIKNPIVIDAFTGQEVDLSKQGIQGSTTKKIDDRVGEVHDGVITSDEEELVF